MIHLPRQIWVALTWFAEVSWILTDSKFWAIVLSVLDSEKSKWMRSDQNFSSDISITIQLKGCVEKSPKWRLINYYILLPNCLIFACETKGEFDIISSVT